MTRKGFLEESSLQGRLQPGARRDGRLTGVGGVLGTVAETTEQVFGERQLRTLRRPRGARGEARTAEEACARRGGGSGENTRDLPFAILYLLDPSGETAQLAGSGGFGNAAHPALPATFDPRRLAAGPGRSTPWCASDGSRSSRTSRAASPSRFPRVRWSTPPGTAMVLPLASADRTRRLRRPDRRHQPASHARRAATAAFFELVAAQVVDRRSRNARAYEEERTGAPRRSPSSIAPRPLLLQRQPRVPHAAHADARPARGRARRRDGTCPGAPRAARRSCTATRCGCSSSSTRCSTSRASRRAASQARLRADRPRGATPPSSPASSARRCERAGLRLVVDCPPLARAGVRRPRHVGEDRPQPALQRVQVHVRGRDRGRAACTRAARSSSRCATPASDPGGRAAAVFERFHRVEGARGAHARGHRHRPRARAGAGRLHGGESRVESALGAGSTLHASRSRWARRICRPSASARARAHSASALRRRRLRRGGAALAARATRDAPAPTTSETRPRRPARRRDADAAPASCSPTTTPTCASTCAACSAQRYDVEAVADGDGRARGGARAPSRPRPHRRDDAGPRRLRAAPRAARRPAHPRRSR